MEALSSLGFEALNPLLLYSSKSIPPLPVVSATSDPEHPEHPAPDIRDESCYDLIMIWGWLDASPRHLIKYIQLHRSLQPDVPIVLVLSTAASFVGLGGAFHASLPLIYDAVKAVAENPRIFVHAFSNGGAGSFTQFLSFYHGKTGCPMPVAAMLVDSAPGGTKLPSALTRGVSAFLEVVRNRLLRVVLVPMAYLTCCIVFVLPSLLGFEDPISRLRRVLNDNSLVAEGGTRGYVYCKSDAIVGWEDIVEHANEAADRGWKVLAKGFEDGGHIGGYRYHANEYTDLVKEVRKMGSIN
ncbi:hypothetical protein DRE_01239 [Drechslerella stenobrocha 248]|uniref:Indole-diterpene biosynthesis protein PaxU n=1 Tax=Drechslerella stenobrocha 248 TaxID=1043628 RepID=W7HWT5_9PEZI|nr:hypothetical protein DRE_01239 [Drechslerella stenobrocha 248]